MTLTEGTKVRALREARGLLQTFGFNGFSFQHIADLLGIKKPSLYDHFKSKEELGLNLIESYQAMFKDWTETIEIFEAKEKVGAFFEVMFKFACSDGKICPMSSLVTDYHSLPKSMKKNVIKMFDFQKDWLKGVIEEGQKKKVFRKDSSSEDLAELVISIGWGCQLISRVMESPDNIKTAKIQALRALEAK